jgi:hypothetical protein
MHLVLELILIKKNPNLALDTHSLTHSLTHPPTHQHLDVYMLIIVLFVLCIGQYQCGDNLSKLTICFFKQGSSSLVSVRAYWLSNKCCVHKHRKQYLSIGYSFDTGKSITIILPNCIWNYNASEHLDRVQSLHSTKLYMKV